MLTLTPRRSAQNVGEEYDGEIIGKCKYRYIENDQLSIVSFKRTQGADGQRKKQDKTDNQINYITVNKKT